MEKVVKLGWVLLGNVRIGFKYKDWGRKGGNKRKKELKRNYVVEEEKMTRSE